MVLVEGRREEKGGKGNSLVAAAQNICLIKF
jgi:hypothetical protein